MPTLVQNCVMWDREFGLMRVSNRRFGVGKLIGALNCCGGNERLTVVWGFGTTVL